MSYLSKRRNALMRIGGKDDGYIKDGLVFWLDGTDATSTNWIDRIGGLNFAMQDIALTLDGGVSFNASSARGLAESTPESRPFVTCTIEIVLKHTNGGMVFLDHARKNISAGMAYNGMMFFGNEYNVKTPQLSVPKEQIITLSCYLVYNSTNRYDVYGYLNKATIQTENFFDYFNQRDGNYITLGYRTEGNLQRFSGILYQVRIYNRHLTDDEMLHNQSIDMERYNIS